MTLCCGQGRNPKRIFRYDETRRLNASSPGKRSSTMKIYENQCGCAHDGRFYSSGFVHDSGTNKIGVSRFAKIS